MILLDHEQGSPEWFAARAGLCTASCFADVIAQGKTRGQESIGRRNLRIRLVCERLTGRRAEGYESFAMRKGVEMEPLARQAYEVETGRLVRTVGFCRHERLEAGASSDGWCGSDGLIEAKCPQQSAHLAVIRSREIPTEYVAQVQGNLWICERRWADFISFNPDFPESLQLVIVRVERDQAYIDRLAAEVAVFMEGVRAEAAELQGMAGG